MSTVVSWKDERARLVRSSSEHVGRSTWVRETKEAFGCRVHGHRREKGALAAHERSARFEARSYAKKTFVGPIDPLEKQFANLAAEWRRETGGISSVTRIVMHPAYQAIIGLGPEAIPLILKDLAKEVDHWGWALRAIAKTNPVPESAAGNLRLAAQAWLKWGRERGLLP